MELFSHIEKISTAAPEKCALIHGEKSFSYGEIFEYVGRCEALLGDMQTSRMIVFSEEPLHLIAWSLCLAKHNATMMPLNCQLTAQQLANMVKSSDANAIFYDQKHARKCEGLDVALSLSSDDFDKAEPSAKPLSDQEPVPDFLITFSSGSTGAPKPIMIDQKTKLARAHQTIDLYGLNENDVVLCASPFFHSLGQRHTFVALAAGATLVFLDRFTPTGWIEAVWKHKVSFVIAVTSHLQALKEDLFAFSEKLQSLNTIVASSAPISGDFKDQLFKALGCDFHEIYGATEVAIATNLAPRDAKAKFATVGTPCTDIDVKIIKGDVTPCPIGEIGEIIVKTPLCFNGYYGRKDLSEDSFHQGFFKTGDLGFIDEEGFLSYVSRKKDIIISGGINIYPKDIEDVLRPTEGLEDVSVIGVEDELLGEVVVAICVADENIEKQLRQIANKQLAPFQRPLKYFFEDALPLGPSGKIQKQDLRDKYGPMNEDWTAPMRAMMYGGGVR